MTTFPLKLGSQGPEVSDLDRALVRRYPAYALEADLRTPLKADNYYGGGEQSTMRAWQLRSHRTATGQCSIDEFNAIVKNIPFPTGAVKARTGSVMFTMPGSGADWTVGPSFQCGLYAEQRYGIRHQGVSFAQGGYLGFMGGDSKLSYVASNLDMLASLTFLIRTAPEVVDAMAKVAAGVPLRDIVLELIFSGYSKSADGLEDALVVLFGDGGEFEVLRSFVKLVLQFGNPSRRKGAKSGVPGWNPDGSGISRKQRPGWLDRVVVSITNPMDFYAAVPDSDDIRPPFYAEIVTASAQLPYFAHILNIGIQVTMNTLPIFGPILGSFGPAATQLLGIGAGLSSVGMSLLGGLIGGAREAKYDTVADAKIIRLLSAEGIITHLDDLFGLVGALPGLQNHGMYEAPFPELGNRSGVDVGKLHLDLLVAGKLVLL